MKNIFPKNIFIAIFTMFSTLLLVIVFIVYLLLNKLTELKEDINNIDEQREINIDKDIKDIIDKDIKKIIDEKLADINQKIDQKNNDNTEKKIVSDEKNAKDENQDNYKPPSNTVFHPRKKKGGIPFEKLIGMKKEKEILKEFLYLLKNSKEYDKFGELSPLRGVLFYGVPGTGKTLLTRSLAEEAGERVSFYEIASPEFSCGLVGEAPQKVHDLFRDVRINNKRTNIDASIVFIDECEEIFKNLATLGDNTSKDLPNIVNQFKTELTSSDNDPKKPILIVGATNHFNKLDEAIKSRFDYHIEVKVFNQQEREEFFNLRLKQRKNLPHYTQAAKDFLFNQVNDKINDFPEEKQSNRILDKFLDAIVRRAILNKHEHIEIKDIEESFLTTFQAKITANNFMGLTANKIKNHS